MPCRAPHVRRTHAAFALGRFTHGACPAYLLQGAKQFKGAKQWSTAKEYSERALPIARDMVVFDCVDDNGARNTVISELQKLQQEAEAQMKSVTMVD